MPTPAQYRLTTLKEGPTEHREIAESLLYDADQWITGTTPAPDWQSILAHSLLALCDRLEDIPALMVIPECDEEEEP